MPQVMEMVNSRYKDTLRVEPKLYEPNHAVSKGAALYGNNKAIRDLYEKVLKDLKEANPDTPTGKLEDEANKKVADEFSLAPETIETAVNTEMITVASKSIGIRVKNKEGKFVCYNLIENRMKFLATILKLSLFLPLMQPLCLSSSIPITLWENRRIWTVAWNLVKQPWN